MSAEKPSDVPGAVVIDACPTINLLATRREVEIVRALGLRLLDTPYVKTQSTYLWTPPDTDGERGRESVSTDALRTAGHLSTRWSDADALIAAFVTTAALLDDPDASCVALAGFLGAPLMTDDAKERRVARAMFPDIVLMSTLDVLKDAADRLAWDDEQLVQIAFDLRWRGNFAPPRRDPHAGWYASLLDRTDDLLAAYRRGRGRG